MADAKTPAIYINQFGVNVIRFPGGEVNVNIGARSIWGKDAAYKVTAHLRDAEDIMALLLTVDAMKSSWGVDPCNGIDLTIPYFPYARQDRVCNPGEALSVRVMTQMINALGCRSVTVLDPHSAVTPALLDYGQVKTVKDILRKGTHLSMTPYDYFVAPDLGASKRVEDLAILFGKDVVQAKKTRDLATGDITGMEVLNQPFRGAKLLVIDDICDGGRTFIELAKKLSASEPARLDLFVTHGIFSKGFEPFEGLFDAIYYTNSLNQDPSEEHDAVLMKVLRNENLSA